MKLTTFSVVVASVVLLNAPAEAQGGRGGRGGGGGGFKQARNPRVQMRTYHFADTNEDLPYCVFVSSKASKKKKNPLIISLHGYGGGPAVMCRGKVLDLAEAGGYILAAPMGYNPRGWYGAPVFGGRGGEDPSNLTELSEKDVMNVLAMMRKEFNVDDQRTYLMGHSMGGAGALFLGAKYASNWAAIAAMAPAAATIRPNAAEILMRLQENSVGVMIVQGDADTSVPPAGARQWAEAMQTMRMDYKYKEIRGADHNGVVAAGLPDVFAFFKAHSRQ